MRWRGDKKRILTIQHSLTRTQRNLSAAGITNKRVAFRSRAGRCALKGLCYSSRFDEDRSL